MMRWIRENSSDQQGRTSPSSLFAPWFGMSLPRALLPHVGGSSLGLSTKVPRSDPYPPRLEHDESPGQILPSSIHELYRRFTYAGSSTGGKSQKNDPCRLEPVRMHQLTEVLVLGEEDTPLPKRKSDHRFVIGSR